MERLETKLGNIRLETPLIAVSGVYGIDYEKIVQSRPYIGAVVTKSVTLNPRSGNPEPRIVDTRAGLLNSVGIQNPGVRVFLKQEIPKFRVLEVPVIASVAGAKVDEYVQCSGLIAERDEIDGIELNVSCPNLDAGGIEFGCDASVLEHLVKSVRKVVGKKTLIAKLTPNVTDITVVARAAINGGADVLALINTLRGMAIDLEKEEPKLGNRVGGLSGIGIHPVAVYMVYQCYTSCCKAAGVSIIGIGGVSSPDEALELILAGATCVGIGTAMFRDPTVFETVANGLCERLADRGAEPIGYLVGRAASAKVLTFGQIAAFLDVSETKVRWLCRNELLPGRPGNGAWLATMDDIRNWYLRLTARQWANLISDGKLEPVSVGFDLGFKVSRETRGRLMNILRDWQETGVAEVLGQRFESDGTTTVKMKLTEDPAEARHQLENIRERQARAETTSEDGRIPRSVRDDISITFEDELTVAERSVLLSLSPSGLLRLTTEAKLEKILQRDREIVRLLLSSYVDRLARRLRGRNQADSAGGATAIEIGRP
jgi:dihydroorotate dehydrogenase (NAD+) catalytic subunit